MVFRSILAQRSEDEISLKHQLVWDGEALVGEDLLVVEEDV